MTTTTSTPATETPNDFGGTDYRTEGTDLWVRTTIKDGELHLIGFVGHLCNWQARFGLDTPEAIIAAATAAALADMSATDPETSTVDPNTFNLGIGTKITIPDPATATEWIVSWKCEEFDTNGTMVGPVWITDVATYNADPVIVENTTKQANGVTVIGIPFGYEPQGETMPGWVTRGEAEALASLYGVELVDS